MPLTSRLAAIASQLDTCSVRIDNDACEVVVANPDPPPAAAISCSPESPIQSIFSAFFRRDKWTERRHRYANAMCCIGDLHFDCLPIKRILNRVIN